MKEITITLTQEEVSELMLALGSWMGVACMNGCGDQNLINRNLRLANKLGCNYPVPPETKEAGK